MILDEELGGSYLVNKINIKPEEKFLGAPSWGKVASLANGLGVDLLTELISLARDLGYSPLA